jgi:DnaJ-class molecular chaperone
MAPRKTTKTVKPPVPKCPDCDGKGEITETVRVGVRKGRATDHRQSAVCLTCWGSGEATD